MYRPKGWVHIAWKDTIFPWVILISALRKRFEDGLAKAEYHFLTKRNILVTFHSSLRANIFHLISWRAKDKKVSFWSTCVSIWTVFYTKKKIINNHIRKQLNNFLYPSARQNIRSENKNISEVKKDREKQFEGCVWKLQKVVYVQNFHWGSCRSSAGVVVIYDSRDRIPICALNWVR